MKHQKLHKIAPIKELLKSGVQGVKLEPFLKQFVIKLKSEEMAQIIHTIGLINKTFIA